MHAQYVSQYCDMISLTLFKIIARNDSTGKVPAFFLYKPMRLFLVPFHQFAQAMSMTAAIIKSGLFSFICSAIDGQFFGSHLLKVCHGISPVVLRRPFAHAYTYVRRKRTKTEGF